MKILLAVVMSLAVVSSVWAADAVTEKDCKADERFKPADGNDKAECVKKTETAASQDQKKACDQIVGSGGVGAKAATATTVEGTVKTEGKEK